MTTSHHDPWDTLSAREALERAAPDHPVAAVDRRLAWARLVASAVAVRSVEEAAKHLGVSVRKVYSWLRSLRDEPDLAALLVVDGQDPAVAPRPRPLAAVAPWRSPAGRSLVRRVQPDAEAGVYGSVWDTLVRCALEEAKTIDDAAVALKVGRRTLFRWKSYLDAHPLVPAGRSAS